MVRSTGTAIQTLTGTLAVDSRFRGNDDIHGGRDQPNIVIPAKAGIPIYCLNRRHGNKFLDMTGQIRL
jgi:hypothetical protein